MPFHYLLQWISSCPWLFYYLQIQDNVTYFFGHSFAFSFINSTDINWEVWMKSIKEWAGVKKWGNDQTSFSCNSVDHCGSSALPPLPHQSVLRTTQWNRPIFCFIFFHKYRFRNHLYKSLTQFTFSLNDTFFYFPAILLYLPLIIWPFFNILLSFNIRLVTMSFATVHFI